MPNEFDTMEWLDWWKNTEMENTHTEKAIIVDGIGANSTRWCEPPEEELRLASAVFAIGMFSLKPEGADMCTCYEGVVGSVTLCSKGNAYSWAPGMPNLYNASWYCRDCGVYNVMDDPICDRDHEEGTF